MIELVWDWLTVGGLDVWYSMVRVPVPGVASSVSCAVGVDNPVMTEWMIVKGCCGE